MKGHVMVIKVTNTGNTKVGEVNVLLRYGNLNLQTFSPCLCQQQLHPVSHYRIDGAFILKSISVNIRFYLTCIM